MQPLEDITWLGHASFFFIDQITGRRVYYIDPYMLPNKTLVQADLIFITHAHHDHLSPEDIRTITHDQTIIIATKDCIEKLGIPKEQQQIVFPNKTYTVSGITFKTIPAYNTHPKRLSFHPQTNKWVGYILTINGKKIYHAGDTDFIDDMKLLKGQNLDVAMLPIGGTYTMDVAEAIDAANAIGAKYTIPMHYRRLLGESYTKAEEQFKRGVTNSEVVILEELT